MCKYYRGVALQEVNDWISRGFLVKVSRAKLQEVEFCTFNIVAKEQSDVEITKMRGIEDYIEYLKLNQATETKANKAMTG